MFLWIGTILRMDQKEYTQYTPWQGEFYYAKGLCLTPKSPKKSRKHAFKA